MLNYIRLVILDLDFLVLDPAQLKAKALAQSLLSFADILPLESRLPGPEDIEAAYLEHGLRWIRSLELGLSESNISELEKAYRLQEIRYVEAGAAPLHPGISAFLQACSREGLTLAIGAEATREYLMAVSDRHGMDQIFEFSLCTEEFSVGSAGEMFEELMNHAEVIPSEAIVLATRPFFFDACRSLDLCSVGCGWGIRDHSGLGIADFQSPSVQHLLPLIRQADSVAEGESA